jgi:hypothetical protein
LNTYILGFCNGLAKSCIFLPILSRGAINDVNNSRSNFTALTASSNCDNVLLEHRLALELQQRGDALVENTQQQQCDPLVYIIMQ